MLAVSDAMLSNMKLHLKATQTRLPGLLPVVLMWEWSESSPEEDWGG